MIKHPENFSAGEYTEQILNEICLANNSDDSDFWKGRATAFTNGLIRPLHFLHEQGDMQINAAVIRHYFELSALERFAYDEQDTWPDGRLRFRNYIHEKYGSTWDTVIGPLQNYVSSLSGYDLNKIGNQSLTTVEQHGYVMMQLSKIFDVEV